MKNLIYNSASCTSFGTTNRPDLWKRLTNKCNKAFGTALLAAGLSGMIAPATAFAQQESGNLDQIRNGSETAVVTPIPAWVNGNANSTQAHYLEGHSIAYRLVLENLTTNQGMNLKEQTLIIEWDHLKGVKNAIDFITHYQNLDPHNVTGSPAGPFNHDAEIILPLQGLTGVNNSIDDHPIDGSYLTNTPGAGMTISPRQAFINLGAAKTVMTLFGAGSGDIISMNYVASDPDKTRLEIKFNTQYSKVVFAWGGHIASQENWGVGNSAVFISGSPYHTRFISLNGKGGNQDRSLQSAAVTPIFAPTCDVNGPIEICLGDGNQVYTSSTDKVNPTYVWSIINNNTGASIVGLNSLDEVEINPGNMVGTYEVQVAITKDGLTTTCSEVTTVYGLPAVSYGADITLTCANPSVERCPSGLTQGVNYDFSWTGPNDFISSDSCITFNASSDAGVYTVEVTNVATGCKGTDQIEIFMDMTAPELDLGADQTITCTNNSAQVCPGGLLSGIDYGFSWTGPNDFMSADSCLTFTALSDAGVYTLVVTNLSNGCTDTDEIEIFKNVTEPELDLGADVEIACGQTSMQICPGGLLSGIDYSFSWTGPNFASSDSCVTVNEAGTYTLVVTNLANGCTDTDEIEVSIEVCEAEMHCTLTQGGYGNANGKICGQVVNPGPIKPRVQLINSLLSSSLTIGGANRSVTFGVGAGQCVVDRLPGGGTAGALQIANNTHLNGCAIPNNSTLIQKNGRFNNVLAGQTVTLALNIRLDALKAGGLGSVALQGTMTTYGATSCDPAIAEPILSDVLVRTISPSVITYLTNMGANDVNGLLALANKALNGDGNLPSASDINQAVSAINEVFHECRMMIEEEEMVSLAKSTLNLNAEKLMSAYPNPFTDKATIEVSFAEAQDYTIQLYDVKGSVVANIAAGKAEAGKLYTFEINASELNDGMYFARLVSKNKVETIKLVLRR